MESCAALIVSIIATIAASLSACAAVKTYLSQSTPNVIAYVAPSKNNPLVALLYIENIGKAPAYDVSMRFAKNPPFELRHYIELACRFLDSGIPFLPPGGMRYTIIGPFADFIDTMGYTQTEIELTWTAKPFKRKETAIFPFEAMSFHGMGDAGSASGKN